MQFRSWLHLSESVMVKVNGGEAALGRASNAPKVIQLSYGNGEHESNFEIHSFSSHRVGYASVSNSASVVGVIKTTPIFADNGADRAFIQALTSALQGSGYKSLPYREGESDWSGVFKAAGMKDDDPVIKSMGGEKDAKGPQLPKMGEKGSNQTQITGGMSVSRVSGSWAYFIEVQNGWAEGAISSIERMMKKAIQPLIDHDLVEYYRIVRGWDYRNEEVVWSQKGRRERDDHKAHNNRVVAFIKFLAERMLVNHPKAKDAVLGRFTLSWNKDVKAENTRVPLHDVREYIKHYQNESPFLAFFADAIEKDDEHMYRVLDAAAEIPRQDAAIDKYKEIADERWDYIVSKPILYSGPAMEAFRMSEFLSATASENWERFKKEYTDAVNERIRSGEPLSRHDISSLKDLAEYIEIEGSSQIKDAHAKNKKGQEESERKQREAEETALARKQDRFEHGCVKYMMVGSDAKWTDVPDRYINRYGEIDIGALAVGEELVDSEELFYAAHEKASEEASSEAEERKSESYGQDKEEVESDIEYEWDDYAKDRFEEGAFKEYSDDEAVEEIKKDHMDDFIDWKRGKLKEEEEGEAWKYEPEPDEDKIREYQEEFAEKKAYEEGLVTVRWNEDSNDDLEVMLNSKHLQKAKEKVRKSIAISMEDKDSSGDPYMDKNQIVEFDFVDSEASGIPKMRARDV